MGDVENNIPLGLSLITKEANANTYTNLHLFAEFRKIATVSGDIVFFACFTDIETACFFNYHGFMSCITVMLMKNSRVSKTTIVVVSEVM